MQALRVLVVEDDTITGMLLGELLEAMGHVVCAIESTEASAVTAAARCRPDLMIVDVHLGDGSGVSAVEEILRSGPVSHVFVMVTLQTLGRESYVGLQSFRSMRRIDARRRNASAL